MEQALGSLAREHPFETVFWGGGTPGLLPAADLERLGRAVLEANGGVAPVEWTVEMAPATVKADKLKVLRDLGVNRISMGVQTFQPALLEALGRIHSHKQVQGAIELLHRMDWENFNLDLIFAIPGQGFDEWQADLEAAVAAAPAHLSTYCLTFEEDTALWVRLQKGQVHRLSLEEEARFYEMTWEFLEGEGYRQYEISNYARPGFACLHNLNTWRMHEWIGVGPSASSQSRTLRWTEPHSLEAWLEGVHHGQVDFVDRVPIDDRILAQDLLVFGLRMNEGVDLAALEVRFPGALPQEWPDFQKRLLEAGLARLEAGRLLLSPEGRLVADRIGAEILALE
jgi:oxygen-independent coproporphyrinogen-3 oxidase